MDNFYKVLVKTSLFSGLTVSKTEKILKRINFQIKSYEKNESIFFRGDSLEHIIIILEGGARGEMQKITGDPITIDYLSPRQVIAPAFIFGSDRTLPVDLISTGKSKLLFLNRQDFLNVLQEDKVLLTNFIDEISNKGQLLSKRIWFNFVNRTISEKLINYIKIHHKHGFISFNPSISELAKKFEVTRPSLSREISVLSNKGVLSKVKGNKYEVNLNKL